MTRRTIPAALTVAVLALAGTGSAAMARHGADDPVGHDANDDHGGQTSTQPRSQSRDDRGHHHHRGGHDDGPNHR
jgi:hypothetical protein